MVLDPYPVTPEMERHMDTVTSFGGMVPRSKKDELTEKEDYSDKVFAYLDNGEDFDDSFIYEDISADDIDCDFVGQEFVRDMPEGRPLPPSRKKKMGRAKVEKKAPPPEKNPKYEKPKPPARTRIEFQWF